MNRGIALLVFVFAGLASNFAAAATPDPILQGPPPGPCDVSGPDYVPGADAAGNPVPPADAGAQPIPVPGDIAVPLPGGGQRRGDRPYTTLDSHKVDRLVNPPACSH